MFPRTLALTSALLLSSPVLAAGFDQAVEAQPPTITAPALAPVATGDWTGFYAGAQLGFGRFSIDSEDDSFEGDEGSGLLYGVHAGYMRDLGRIVVGGELDLDGSQFGTGGLDGFDLSSIARAKVRLGYDLGRILPYVTAGAARLTLDSGDAATSNLIADSYSGGFAGLGADYAISDRFLVGAEVLRHQFKDAPVDGFDADVTSVTVRASLRF